MNLFLTILSGLGSLASIAGAVYACKQAGISKTAAELAQNIKNQLINNRKTSELTELQILLDSAQKAFLKYASTQHTSLVGNDKIADAHKALDFISKLKAFRDYFNSDSGNAADKTYTAINTEVTNFKNATNNPDTVTYGTNIHTRITSFSPLLNKKLTGQKESTI
jgi:hypothetical protein